MIEMPSVVAAAVAESLLHFLWQGTLLGVLAFILLRRAGAHAGAKYALGIGTLAAMLLAPIVTTLWILSGGGSTGAVPTTASAPTMAASSLPVAWVLGFWACGVVVCGVRLAGGWVVARRMTTRAVKPVADDIQAMATRVAARLSVTTPFRVLESTIAASPMMIGWLKPVVLLPTATLAGLSPSQLEALLAHEFAHMRRHDYLVNLLQSAIETLLFYHPAVWLVSRSVRESREQCCDDLTISVCDRLTYVSALSSVAALRTSPPALAAGGGSLRYRVERLLRPQSPASFSAGSMGWLGVIPIALVLAAAMPMTSTSPVSTPRQVSDIVAPAPLTPAESVSVAVTESTTVTTPPQAQPAPLSVRPALPVVLDYLMPTTQAMPLQAPPPPATQQIPVRRVAVGDALSLEFYGLVDSDNEMRKRYVVGPDGALQVKYAGAIMAAGKTLPEIAAAVLDGLQPKFYPMGVLQVVAVEFRSTQNASALADPRALASQEFAAQSEYETAAGLAQQYRDSYEAIQKVPYTDPRIDTFPPMFVDPQVHQWNQQLTARKSALSRLSVGESHPDYQAAVARINEAEAELKRARDLVKERVRQQVVQAEIVATSRLSALNRVKALRMELGTKGIDYAGVQRYRESDAAALGTADDVQRVTVAGMVLSPGEKNLRGTMMTASRAIGAANGFVPSAGEDIEIRRVVNGKPTIIKVTRTQLASGDDPPLVADDIVTVKQGYVFFVNGEVNAPGPKVWSPGMTVIKALGMANGLTPRAKLSHIERPVKDATGKVIRKVQIKKLKDDTEILPDDVLVIARKWFGE